jgi:hypothetical protein
MSAPAQVIDHYEQKHIPILDADGKTVGYKLDIVPVYKTVAPAPQPVQQQAQVVFVQQQAYVAPRVVVAAAAAPMMVYATPYGVAAVGPYGIGHQLFQQQGPTAYEREQLRAAMLRQASDDVGEKGQRFQSRQQRYK